MTDREVMQQALEALESCYDVMSYPADGKTRQDKAITALRKPLEQPEQEPSQWRDMVVVNLVREGINKHKARELADHFATAAQPENGDIRALKYRIHELEGEVIGYKRIIEETALKKLADLGQEIEQEPVAWILTDENINSIQVASVQRLIDRLKHAHHTDLCVRINGQDEWFQADWLKHMVRATPPAAQPDYEFDYKLAFNEWLDKTEWVQEKINSGHLGVRYLGMHRADVLRDLAYPNTVTGKAPQQRPWVGLTDEEKKNLATAAGCTEDDDGHIVTEIFRLAEAKLKEKNT